MRLRLSTSGERPLSAIPWTAKTAVASGLIALIAWHIASPAPVASSAALSRPPAAKTLRLLSLGEPIAVSHALMLYLQAFDNQPGLSIPYRSLDYGAVEAWLTRALELDPRMQYPLMMAANLYSQVPDAQRQRRMLEFVHREFMQDPDRRWRWLAHAALVARHRLKDMPLALRYADDISRNARSASSWARQMRIFILEDMGEREAATILLGGLLASGEVSDPAEVHFLTERLEKLQNAENSTPSSVFR